MNAEGSSVSSGQVRADGSPRLEAFKLYIDGEWCESASGRWLETKNPYTGKAWAVIPRGNAQDVDRAVQAANRAFVSGPWASMHPSDRGLLLHRLGDLIAANAERLAELEVRDNGKLRVEMLGQMKYLPRWFQYYGGLADKIEGRMPPTDKKGMLHYVSYEPVGVVGAITPWNSPLLLTVWKLAPALAAGNTVVIKPSEYASTSLLALVELFEQAGFPKGVVNVVTGLGAETGEPLVEHPCVDRIAFTGGNLAGRNIYEAAARQFKRVSLELGGKSPNIVFGDAGIEDAVKGVISGIFAASGQTCMAGSRLLLHSSIHDAFLARLVEVMKAARLGDPNSPDTDVGPVATEQQLQKVLDYIELAKEEGARCILGGRRATRPECGEGWFVEPTIFADVTNDMRIAREEVFGPVLSVIKFDSDDEAVALANDTPFGLAAGLWTTDLARSLSLPKRLRAGTVWVNAYRVVSYLSPFGGFKESGLGRENGLEAIYEYMEAKSVFINPRPAITNPFTLQ
ncbi:aldehyde dehydrogenase [Bradyrhizobium sp. CNPSo 4010]|uniref:Aldehyde dehydrogenase n=1 Tax=Bradyrhizobium agreste TaxID=2751811 RepID=A0ABS0PZX3_9BRAD|nr:aldehyde dehydrogenase [Bradyrhizobium agreste]MBH5402431.1 aldehyde dehydrogenase [Bradyrhizobium agreste]